MPKDHLKTHNAPTTWTMNRKERVFVAKPKPGAHKLDLSMSINMVMKNLLGKSKTRKETKKILHQGDVLVNGVKRWNHKYSVGLLDVISFPKENRHYVMLINKKNKLYTQELDKKEAGQKLSKVTDKRMVKGGKIQLKTLDGRSVAAKKGKYKTGETVVLSIPDQEIKDSLALEKGATILLFRGRHVGKIATVQEIEQDSIKLEHEKEEFETKKEYAIVIGKDKPIINIK